MQTGEGDRYQQSGCERRGADRLTFLNGIALALTIPGTDTEELRDCRVS
jgi:hypothetical protein